PDRAAGPERLLDRRQQVALTAGDVAQCLEARVELGLVAGLLELRKTGELALLGLGIDLEDVHVVDAVADVLVDADDDVLAGPIALVVAGGGLLDLALHELERVHRSA